MINLQAAAQPFLYLPIKEISPISIILFQCSKYDLLLNFFLNASLKVREKSFFFYLGFGTLTP